MSPLITYRKRRAMIAWIAGLIGIAGGGFWGVAKYWGSPPSSPALCSAGSQVGLFGNRNTVNCTTYFGISPEDSAKMNQIDAEQAVPGLEREVDDFSFKLNDCLSIQADTVNCPFTVLNNGPDRYLTIGTFDNQSFIIDTNGNQQFPQAAQIGTAHGFPATTFLASGVPVHAAIKFGGNGQPIQGIRRLWIAIGVREINGGAPSFIVKWETVPITTS